MLNDKESLRFFKTEELRTFFGNVVKTSSLMLYFNQVVAILRVLLVDDAPVDEKNVYFRLLEALQKPPAMDEAAYRIAVMMLMKICIRDADAALLAFVHDTLDRYLDAERFPLEYYVVVFATLGELKESAAGKAHFGWVKQDAGVERRLWAIQERRVTALCEPDEHRPRQVQRRR